MSNQDKDITAHAEAHTAVADPHEPKAIEPVPLAERIKQQHAALYIEALEKYGEDGSIDPVAEKQLKRKLDMRILPLLGVCYFFYYVDKTTLSYAAIFGIKTDIKLVGTEYSWLSSVFYFGWLVWAIPSNLIMQRSPPAYYLALNIFMWGVLLMCQAAANNFASLTGLRILSGAFEAIADPAFMLITSMYYTRSEQPSRISAWYCFNGLGVAGGGLIGYGIGHVKGALASWRYEFIIVGAGCAAWGIVLFLLLPNSPATFWGFTHEEKLLMIARMRKNQTGVENRRIKWDQVVETYTDYKTYMFCFLGFIANIPNGGISNFSTLVIQGLGFNTLQTALLGIPQGVLVVIWIGAGAIVNQHLPKNSRTIVCGLFMVPTIAGALGFLLAPSNAYVGRLICFYLTGSYQASFVISLSLITSNTGGQTKKMLVSGMIWFGACVGNIAGPFFYKSDQAPKYQMGIGSLLAANIIEFLMFFAFRYAFKYENRKKRKARENVEPGDLNINATAFADLTDKQNPNFEGPRGDTKAIKTATFLKQVHPVSLLSRIRTSDAVLRSGRVFHLQQPAQEVQASVSRRAERRQDEFDYSIRALPFHVWPFSYLRAARDTESEVAGIDFLSKTMHLEDWTVQLQLWDTVGASGLDCRTWLTVLGWSYSQERFRSLIPSNIRDSSVAVMVYEITSEPSWNPDAHVLTRQIEHLSSTLQSGWMMCKLSDDRMSWFMRQDVIIVLVGNKTDLDDKRRVEG
ncbi:hypothetical protein EHS25_001924 [Saitozyma podzolica]|uniref:Major facilitator superfamily (MFS) profile domain-containing protein n=1 Tax=Saitozyma podzolica TaxID=1890683 RepID=A0A427YFR6_9TREE|nr:hypothetical protein EHS25_001924 [Saitozyma podzolica]